MNTPQSLAVVWWWCVNSDNVSHIPLLVCFLLHVKHHSWVFCLFVLIVDPQIFNVLSQVLDHASEPRRQEKADGPKQAHYDEHPQEDPVNHHGDVLPVFLHLCGIKSNKENKD